MHPPKKKRIILHKRTIHRGTTFVLVKLALDIHNADLRAILLPLKRSFESISKVWFHQPQTLYAEKIVYYSFIIDLRQLYINFIKFANELYLLHKIFYSQVFYWIFVNRIDDKTL